MNYKVAVVGAGPGGAVLARELAARGIDVTIYEKSIYGELGHDWSDAVEFGALKEAGLEMPVLEGRQWKGSLVKTAPDGGGIFEKHAVPILRIYSPGKKTYREIEFKMITTDRRRLAQELVRQAGGAGAKIKYLHEGRGLLYREKGRADLEGVEVYGVVVRDLENEEDIEIRADLVVESSGFSAVLRGSLPGYSGLAEPFQDSDFALVHREVRPYRPELEDGAIGEGGMARLIPDHYRYGYQSGYQWTHIHNEERIDVGAGVKRDSKSEDPRDIIEAFIAEHPAIKAPMIRGGRSLCIVGRPLSNFVAPGFLVLGDAASTSVPTTGCGVGSAIYAALGAAEVVCEAALENRNDLRKLWDVNKKFYLESDRGPSLAALSELRIVLQTLSSNEIDLLFEKGLLDAATLQQAINGHFSPLPAAGKARALLAGFSVPGILVKLNRAVTSAAKIYDHYLEYPSSWDAGAFTKWESRARSLQVEGRD